MVEVQNLGKTYRTGKNIVRALDGVSFSAGPGRIIGILGANGAGKTTLFKLICGIIQADCGRVSLFGSENIKAQAHRFGFLPENPEFGRNLNAYDILNFALKVSGQAANRKEISAALEQAGLAGQEQRPLRHFSKGMRQRLGLAQAMIHKPELLILDEPMSGLDPLGRAIMTDLVRSWTEGGGTVLLSTHDLDDIDLLCNEVMVITAGRLTLRDSLAALRKRSTFQVEWLDGRGRTSRSQSSAEQLWSDLAAGQNAGLELVRVKSDLHATLAPFYQHEKP